MNNLTEEKIFDELRPILDPDLGISIIDMGLIYKAKINGDHVDVEMTLTSIGCPYGPYLISEVTETVKNIDSIKTVNVELVWEPPWSIENLSDEVKLDIGIDI